MAVLDCMTTIICMHAMIYTGNRSTSEVVASVLTVIWSAIGVIQQFRGLELDDDDEIWRIRWMEISCYVEWWFSYFTFITWIFAVHPFEHKKGFFVMYLAGLRFAILGTGKATALLKSRKRSRVAMMLMMSYIGHSILYRLQMRIHFPLTM